MPRQRLLRVSIANSLGGEKGTFYFMVNDLGSIRVTRGGWSKSRMSPFPFSGTRTMLRIAFERAKVGCSLL
jgi:hypothetical protein